MRMEQRLDTYAVWEALKAGSECPLCALRRKTERQLIERCLGGAVMSPQDRQRVNAAGFCAEHHRQLYAKNNRLGHALLALSRLQTIRPQLEKALNRLEADAGKRPSRLKRQKAADRPGDALMALSNTCLICQDLEAHSVRQAQTLLYLWQRDPAFKARLIASRWVCLPDAARLLDLAPQLSGEARGKFLTCLRQGLMDNLARLEAELDWFTRKFDYRNQDAPWGQSRDALERTAGKLGGWCLGPEPLNEDAQ